MPSELTDEDRRKKERATILALFLLLLSDTETHLRQQVALYQAGNLSIFALSTAITAALLGAHMHATYLGRRLAGILAPLGLQDQQFAQSVMAEQAAYIDGLIRAIQAGRYTDAGGLDGRLAMYARRLLGTANLAWALSLPAGTMVDWVLSSAEHCADCVARAAGGPYDAHTIPWVPGDGQSACTVNCRCELVTVDGERGFVLE